MISLNSFIKYEKQVLDLLMKKLTSETSTEKKYRTDYSYIHQGRMYRFDLVELGNNDKILKLYEVKTLSAVKSNFYSLKEQLKMYKDITGAIVYLVYLKENDQLQIVQLENLVNEKTESSQINITVKSFSDFYSRLKKVCNNDASDIQYFFRGHSMATFQSIPSIYRNNNIEYEDRMYHEAIRENPGEFTEDMSTFDKLVKMQHYELPTRLLDITTNPLIALYFACKENEDKDGAVLIFSMLNEQIKYFDSDSVCILSNLAKRSSNFSFAKNKDYLVYDIQQDKPNFKGEYLESIATQRVVCVLPKLNNERIVRQHGAFFIFGMGNTKHSPAQFKDKPVSILIKAAHKRDILKELQFLGIDEATLFPETDKIMKQIKTKYS